MVLPVVPAVVVVVVVWVAQQHQVPVHREAARMAAPVRAAAIYAWISGDEDRTLPSEATCQTSLWSWVRSRAVFAGSPKATEYDRR